MMTSNLCRVALLIMFWNSGSLVGGRGFAAVDVGVDDVQVVSFGEVLDRTHLGIDGLLALVVGREASVQGGAGDGLDVWCGRW